jgi:DNA-binding IclR family transcriptional regulator
MQGGRKSSSVGKAFELIQAVSEAGRSGITLSEEEDGLRAAARPYLVELVELDLIRERGFSIDDEENEEGVRCVGLPIMNASGQPVAAFSVSAPANRFSVEDCHRLAPSALAMAAEISRRIGYAAARNGTSGTHGTGRRAAPATAEARDP